jgi:hypothetical protein
MNWIDGFAIITTCTGDDRGVPHGRGRDDRRHCRDTPLKDDCRLCCWLAAPENR